MRCADFNIMYAKNLLEALRNFLSYALEYMIIMILFFGMTELHVTSSGDAKVGIPVRYQFN